MHKSRIMIRISFLLEYLLFPFRPVKLFFLSSWIHIFEVFFGWSENFQLGPVWQWKAYFSHVLISWCWRGDTTLLASLDVGFFHHSPAWQTLTSYERSFSLFFFIFDWQVSCSEFVWIFEGCQETFTSLVRLNQSSNIIDWDYFLLSLFTRVGVPMLYALNFVSMSHSTMVVNGSSIFFRIHFVYILNI